MAVADFKNKERSHSTLNVVQAAKMRIKNVFDSGIPVSLSTSGGKDSLCMMSLVYDFLSKTDKKYDFAVDFIDEEAIFDEQETLLKQWRLKFLELGYPFNWYCLPFSTFNCLNQLEQSDSWLIWNPSKKNDWVRKMPAFAIKEHPLFRMPRTGADAHLFSYQDFLTRVNKGRIQFIGIRAAESVQRRQNLEKIFSNTSNRSKLSPASAIFPIFDWKDEDVWMYIRDNNLQFPEVYTHLFRVGESKGQGMRLSQFYSLDSARSLLPLSEIYPGLMDRVIRREPNAYLVAMYWDSGMFRRQTKRRRANTKNSGESIDYEKRVYSLLKNIDKNFPTPGLKKNAEKIKRMMLRLGSFAFTEKTWENLYLLLVGGDPKGRSMRAFIVELFTKYKREVDIEDGLIKTSKQRSDN